MTVGDALNARYTTAGRSPTDAPEARVHEISAVTFPAYAGATAGVRSLTEFFPTATFARERV